MKKILIVYQSKTGFTKKYAEIVAQKVGCGLMEFRKANAERMSQFDVIVYGSRIFVGHVDKLKEAREMFESSKAKQFVLFATGGTPNKEIELVQKMWDESLTKEEQKRIPHVYMQSGVCYEKLPFLERLLLKIGTHMMKKNKEDATDPWMNDMKSSFDISSEEYATPLINILLHM